MDLMKAIEKSRMINILFSSVSMFCFAGCIVLFLQRNWQGAIAAGVIACVPWLLMLALNLTVNSMSELLISSDDRPTQDKK